jgi:hypothetical protein
MTYPPVPRQSWLWTTLIFLMFNSTFQRALAPVDDWLAKQGVFSHLGLILAPLATFLASATASRMFMRKFGAYVSIQKTLIIGYEIALSIWTLVATALIWFVGKTSQGFLEFAALSAGDLAICGIAAWAGVMMTGRKRRSLLPPDSEVFS